MGTNKVKGKEEIYNLNLSEHYDGLVEECYPDIKLTDISTIIRDELEAKGIGIDSQDYVSRVLHGITYDNANKARKLVEKSQQTENYSTSLVYT
jgi:hypothetical protein